MSEILATFEAQANPEVAADKAAYHKTTRKVLGVPNPQIDAVVRAWKANKPVGVLLDEARALWASEVFEARIAAPKLLTKARFREHEDDIWNTLVSWMPDLDGWAISDHCAAAGGRRLMADLTRLDELERWTTSDHLWTKRAAMVFSLPLAKLTHPKPDESTARNRVLDWAALYVTDHTWFIQKSIGWWLRTLSVHDPLAVRDFIEAHGDQMKAFARREALRKIG